MSSKPNRILILRLSAVGDTILSLPILCALRQHFPDAELAWVVGSGAADLLRGHPDLDELFVLNKDDLRSPLNYWRFLQRVRRWNPDTVIDAQGLTKSAWIGRYCGARQRIGFARSEFDGRELSGYLNNTLIAPTSEHVVTRGLELLKPLGIEHAAIDYRLPSDPGVVERVDLQHRELSVGSSCAMINVGAGWPSKIWPTDRYAAIARHLGNHWGLPSIIAWGGSQEKAIAEQVASESKGWAQMMPQTSLVELAEWIRRSSLFVGSDTGPMHLSVAVNTPTVGLIGPMPIERVGPLGWRHIGVQRERLSTSEPTHRKSDLRPMLSICVEDVADACDTLCSRIRRTCDAA